jgi:hypothetical protein
MRHHTEIPRRVTHRFSIAAICGFVMFSATFAVATAFRPAPAFEEITEQPVLDPVAQRAEAGHQQLLDERLHLHFKRLHALRLN